MSKRGKQVLLDSPALNLLPADRVYGRDDPIHRRTITPNIGKRTVLRTDSGNRFIVSDDNGCSFRCIGGSSVARLGYCRFAGWSRMDDEFRRYQPPINLSRAIEATGSSTRFLDATLEESLNINCA